MALRYSFKSQFQTAFDKLPKNRQSLTLKALEALQSHFEGKAVSHGLGVKKLYEGAGRKTFEARVTIDLRIVWVETNEEVVFALIGSHDDVRRFLKSL